MADELALGSASVPPLSAARPVAAGPWTEGTYYALPPIGNPPTEGAPEYDEMPITFAGVDGVGTKNLGFRGRDIAAELVFLYSTTTAAQSAKNALIAALQAARFSATVPGGSARAGCKVKRGGFQDVRWGTIGGRHFLVCSVQIRQMNE